jgi:hypothetical protein
MSKRVKAIGRIKADANEPTPKSVDSQHDLTQLLNWYSYNKNSDDAKSYFLTYLKSNDMDVFEKLKSRTANISVTTSVGWLCRIYTLNENLLDTKYLKNIAAETARLLRVVSDSEVEKASSEPKSRPSVQENMQNQLRELLGELDAEVDNFLSSKCKSSFSLYDWMSAKKLKHVHAKSIGEYFQDNILSELRETQSGTCEQLSEGYSFLSKKEMKQFIAFIESFVDDAQKWQGVAKQISQTNRTPRTRKTKPPLKQVERLQYLKEHGNLKSVPPTQIVGATQLWIYNVKYKTLGVYVCNNAHGFMVKGCTILNFDTNESISKTLRKPEEILPGVMDAGKVALRKILPSLRTREKKLTGRINKDTILLRVL